MNFNKKRALTFQQLEESLRSLEKALETLRYSYVKCKKITGKDKLNAEDQESFEALTSRFARTADILTQKVLKSLFALIHERPRTFLDAANLLEKIEKENDKPFGSFIPTPILFSADLTFGSSTKKTSIVSN